MTNTVNTRVRTTQPNNHGGTWGKFVDVDYILNRRWGIEGTIIQDGPYITIIRHDDGKEAIYMRGEYLTTD